MIIGIDIDDVIYQTSEAMKSLVDGFDDLDFAMKMEVLKGNVNIPMVKKIWKDSFLAICKQDKIVEGAVEGVERLRRKHKVFLITARGDENYPGMEEVTREMLVKDGVEYDKIIFNSLDKAKDCEAEGVRLFVDDSPRNCAEVAEKAKIPVVGFATEVTRDELKKRKIFSVDNWADLEKVIREITDGEEIAGATL